MISEVALAPEDAIEAVPTVTAPIPEPAMKNPVPLFWVARQALPFGPLQYLSNCIWLYQLNTKIH